MGEAPSNRASSAIDNLRLGFRDRYLSYDDLTTQLHRWRDAYPHLLRLESLTRTREGRELWLLVVGPDPDRKRPAVWVDGNMHAAELCGSNVALAIAEDVLRLHLDSPPTHCILPPHVVERLRDVLFYIVPRVSPDGAEAVLESGRYVRSVPRDERPNRNAARWLARDMNGDGLSLLMRQRDPCGEFIESEEYPGLMLERRLEDQGPYYKLYPEGIIENYDGRHIPPCTYLADSWPDLNRNFPWSWVPEFTQAGAGSYPGSEPEARAIIEFATSAPHLFAWLNLHSFGGVFIRPLGEAPDSRMPPEDLALFRQIETWNREHAGYPTVSGFEEFTYQPEQPLHGDLSDYAYHQRGCIAYVCELWDLFEQVGIGSGKRFVDRYTHLSREDIEKLSRWDRSHNGGQMVRPWIATEHPQLGPVEVGGFDPRFGVWNPPSEQLQRICEGQSSAFLRVAAMAPAVTVSEERRTAVGEALMRIDLCVENRGYLPTYILNSALRIEWNEPLCATVATNGCKLVDPSQSLLEIGHLDGWGRGLFAGAASPGFPRSAHNNGRRRCSLLVNGRGVVTVRVGACRIGWQELTIEI